MRLRIATIVPLCVVLIASIARGKPTLPYKAYITSDDVYVRSGPGKGYYPTDKLKAGQEVEVYRHDPGGWYAIRPPEGSFTWVSGRFIKPLEDGLGEVTAQRVAARVGSRFSNIRDVIQIRLHRGEMVELLDAASGGGTGRKKDSEKDSEKKWYKIAPPSGEFRWVFGKFVDPDYPVDGVRKVPDSTSPLVQHNVARPAVAATHESATGTARRAEVAPSRPTSATTVTVPQEAVRRDSPNDRPAVPRQLSPDEFQTELQDVDLELSIMVTEEPTVWTFDELSLRARSLLAQAETALERGRARVIANKINRFEDIRTRYQAVNSMWADTGRRNRRLAELSRSRGDSRQQSSAEDRFDGQGRLTRVVSPAVGAPRYALMDASGEVRCYVTPAPGVNLRHYEGREIGVNGTRGYMPEQRAHHVMAKHVWSLEDRRLR